MFICVILKQYDKQSAYRKKVLEILGNCKKFVDIKVNKDENEIKINNLMNKIIKDFYTESLEIYNNDKKYKTEIMKKNAIKILLLKKKLEFYNHELFNNNDITTTPNMSKYLINT